MIAGYSSILTQWRVGTSEESRNRCDLIAAECVFGCLGCWGAPGERLDSIEILFI